MNEPRPGQPMGPLERQDIIQKKLRDTNLFADRIRASLSVEDIDAFNNEMFQRAIVLEEKFGKEVHQYALFKVLSGGGNVVSTQFPYSDFSHPGDSVEKFLTDLENKYIKK